MQIIGISGRRGVGKSALAAYYHRHKGFDIVSFAGPLKAMAKSMMPFTEADLTNVKKKEAPFKEYSWTPREFLINLGEFMRYHEPNYWLNKGLAACSLSKGRYVFDDVRYVNEADAIREMGGKIIRVNRYEKSNPYGKNLDIASENNLDNYKFDFTIHDCVNTTLDSLHQEGDFVLKELEW